MIIKPRGTVTLPRPAKSGLSLLPWCKEVNRALQELRDRVIVTPKGRGGGGAAINGAFYNIYTVSSETGTNGDIMLQGGQVTAGDGTESISDILLYDADGAGWSGSDGEFLQIAINGTGEETDGVLLPVFNQDPDGSEITNVTAIADNILPEVGSLAGLCNVSLGTFGTNSFRPSLNGNIQVSFCFGGFTVSRF